jgi:transposase
MKIPKRVEFTVEEVEQLRSRIINNTLTEQDRQLLPGLLDSIVWMGRELEEKKLSIKRLRRVFGIITESTKNLLKKVKTKKEDESEKKDTDKQKDSSDKGDDKKKKGHGRNGVDAYWGAKKVRVEHPTLKPGDICPMCHKSKLYENKDKNHPGIVIRITGNAPLTATAYEVQKLKCSGCQAIFKADLPKEAGDKKYDHKAGAIVSLMKYGAGMPFHRLAGIQQNTGTPVPKAVQWDIVKGVGDCGEPIYNKMIEIAAQGEILHNDDTKAKILSIMQENRKKEEGGEKLKRKGIFTSGIISIVGTIKIALFFTGMKTAGENLDGVLEKRESDKEIPLQMCDALSQNLPKRFKSLVCNCLTHGRRKFAEIIENWPEECRYVIEMLKEVYANDEIARQKKMTPEERLQFHKKESSKYMSELKEWLDDQIENKKVEPNSSLGLAINYMRKRWPKLTRFLEVAGAPLDNNIVERALKLILMFRKNSYFYKTENGAKNGDILTSILQTCSLCKTNPIEYLEVIQEYREEVAKYPEKWLPWNYKNTWKALLQTSRDPP